MAEFFLDDQVVHAYWDNSLRPRLIVRPGDTITVECRDASDGQIGPHDDESVLAETDFSRIHPLTGPIVVEGASPGDSLEIEILDLQHKGWGWNAIRPGFGLLKEDFSEPYLHHWKMIEGRCLFRDGSEGVEIPFRPFCGVLGVAPHSPGRFDTTPPRKVGGNLDIKSLGPGATLWLPVEVPGALFSVGDCHAAQGDGEVCGNGIEAPMMVTVRLNLRRGEALPRPHFLAPPTPMSESEYYATTAHGPDLYENAKLAIRQMIDHIHKEYALSENEAYILCSVAVDLRISQIVNEPDWLVSAYLPVGIFDT